MPSQPAFNPYAPPASDIDPQPLPAPFRPSPPARRRDRFLAALIDAIPVWAAVVPVEVFIAKRNWQFDELYTFGWIAIELVVWVAINGYFLVTSSQTLGKRLLALQIVNASDGRPTPFGKIVLARKLPMMLVALVPVFGWMAYYIGLAFILGDERRCIHDVIAGTKVVDLKGKRVLRL